MFQPLEPEPEMEMTPLGTKSGFPLGNLSGLWADRPVSREENARTVRRHRSMAENRVLGVGIPMAPVALTLHV